MSFDKLLTALQTRIAEFENSGDASKIQGDAPLVEVSRMLEYVAPGAADSGYSTPGHQERLAKAFHAIGWLHYFRYCVRPADDNLSELARALLYFTPIAHNPEMIPKQLATVLGPTASLDMQADVGMALLYAARATVDPAPLQVGLDLLTVVSVHDHADRASRLSHLGAAHGMLYERTGERADLDRAIEVGEHAIAEASRDDPGRASFLVNLANAYKQGFECTGSLSQLDRAVELVAEAITITHPTHPQRPAMLTSLGATLVTRYERNGVLQDLDRAIDLGAEAVAAASSDDDRSLCLFNLGAAYQFRFMQASVQLDLDHAIETCAEAVSLTRPEHPKRASRLFNLGTALRLRYERTGIKADLDRAIQFCTEAVAGTHGADPRRAQMLNLLAAAHTLRSRHFNTSKDVDCAIELGTQAVAAMPVDHPAQPAAMSNLGAAYALRFNRSGAREDLNRAIDVGSEALALITPDHANSALCLTNLASSYLDGIRSGKCDPDTKLLNSLAVRYEQSTTGSPQARVAAAFMVGSVAHAIDEGALAVELLDAALAMAPSVPPRESDWDDQEHSLGLYNGLVAETVAAHCSIGDPTGAVEAAELGRTVLLAPHVDSRTDLTDLDATCPEYAANFRGLRTKLDWGDPTATMSNDSVPLAKHRKRLWAEHDALVALIRQQPGFDRFLLPPRLTTLTSAVSGGAAVLVNAGRRRSDAVIVTAEGDPLQVRLPELRRGDLHSKASMLIQATHNSSLVERLRAPRMLFHILAWLWDSIVAPILDAYPTKEAVTDLLPRVWWIPTGLLGLFPLHAAGRRDQPGALDEVISSYTPTLRALAHGHTRPPASHRGQLIVALENSGDLPALPGTIAEAKYLHSQRPDVVQLLDGDATATAVLAALPKATWAHFACHAEINFRSQSRGGLRLYDRQLPLAEISRLRLEQAEIAYLSACSTAFPGVRNADEALHLASAFQLAGFRHVVASLWPLDDSFAASAARAFYTRMPDDAMADHASNALHQATVALRTERPDRPQLWASLVHAGP